MAAMGKILTQRRKGAETAEKVRLGEVAHILYGERIRKQDSTGDTYPVYGGGGETFRWATYNREDVCIVSRFAMSKECVRFVRGKFFLNDSGLSVSSLSKYLLQEYLDWFLLGNQEKIYLLSQGAAQRNLNVKAFSSISISLPPLPEQKRIAATLDRICELKKNAETRLAKLDLLVKSRFVEMFGEGKYPEVTIESLAAHEKNAFKAGPFGSSLKKEFYVESGYKIYGQEQVISGDANYGNYYIDEAKYKTLESCKIQEGDVLVSLVGTYGKTLVIPHSFQPGIINPRLIKLTFDKERISPIYFQQFFSLDSTRDMLDRNCHGCTMGVLNLGIIKALKIPLPPLALQREFAAFVEKVEKLKEIAKRSAEQMDVLYRSKLQEYFG